MSAISKELFYRKIDKNAHCSDLHYWESSCLKAVISPYFVSNVVKGTAKFFFPIYLLKLMINYKKIKDVEFIKSLVLAEGTAILYGVGLGSLVIATLCTLRKIFGRIHYYNVVVFPGIVSGLSLLIETKENQILNTLIFFNSFVETLLNDVNFSLFEITETREVLLFMAVSAVLMYLLENRTNELNMIYFWFYTPPRRKIVDKPDEEKACDHPSSCWKFWKDGFVKYFSLGYLVNVVRGAIPKIGKLARNPRTFINLLLSTSNVKFGLFIGGYVAVYRMLTCYLLKWGKIRRKFHGLLAGLLSGLTYAISPNIQVVVVGITTILQILYAKLSDRLNIKNNFWPRQLLYMVCHGVLLHKKIFYPNLCSSYYSNMIDACTNNVIPQIYERIISKYFFEEIGRKHAFKYIGKA
ncbi:transmembrane protein 135-like [Anoplophora glabripennis]|uniref:transmembrane protein 135-like n=1 Tax=Anoplophora glabripennis TaxID=217634 RepID=UPI0008744276|nr:transmembrane protein 135-like [Anoplophora glabripennis]